MNLYISILFVLTFVHSQGWNIRVYYNDNRCKGKYVFGIIDYSPYLECFTNTSLRRVCETKSTEKLALSSEGTGCQLANLQTFTTTDIPTFLPLKGQGDLISDVNYVIVNSYAYSRGSQCDVKKGSVAVNQRIHAANGKCFATEPGWFFKASCTPGGASTVWSCSDPSCTQCNQTDFNTSCFEKNDGSTNRVSCIPSSQLQPPLSTSSSSSLMSPLWSLISFSLVLTLLTRIFM